MAQSGINVKYDHAHKIIKIIILKRVFQFHLTRLSHSNAWPGIDILYILALYVIM